MGHDPTSANVFPRLFERRLIFSGPWFIIEGGVEYRAQDGVVGRFMKVRDKTVGCVEIVTIKVMNELNEPLT